MKTYRKSFSRFCFFVLIKFSYLYSFYKVYLPGVFPIFTKCALLTFEEFTNEIFPQDTNIIIEKQLEEILSAQKYLLKNKQIEVMKEK